LKPEGIVDLVRSDCHRNVHGHSSCCLQQTLDLEHRESQPCVPLDELFFVFIIPKESHDTVGLLAQFRVMQVLFLHVLLELSPFHVDEVAQLDFVHSKQEKKG